MTNPVEVDVRSMRILIADDNDSNSELLRQLLVGAGYTNVSVTRAAEEVPRLCATDPAPDLLLLDLHMPGLSGYEILSRIRPLLLGPPYLPVLVVTADATTQAKRRALSLGASDFVTKPVDAAEVLLRTRNLLRVTRLQRQLEGLVTERVSELSSAHRQALGCVARVSEYREDPSAGHATRVGHCASAIAERLGLEIDVVQRIRLAAALHDVGKIVIPEEMLGRPGPLTADEMGIVRAHVNVGAEILTGDSPELTMARDVALYHHERWDGAGYGAGLKGVAIPIAARITAVANTFDALTHDRPYRSALPVEEAFAEVLARRGAQLDPSAVDAFAGLDHEALLHPERAEATVDDGAPAAA